MNTKSKYWLMLDLLSGLLLLLAGCGAAASPQPAAEGYASDQALSVDQALIAAGGGVGGQVGLKATRFPKMA